MKNDEVVSKEQILNIMRTPEIQIDTEEPADQDMGEAYW